MKSVNYNRSFILLPALLLTISLLSCRKYVDVERPPYSLTVPVAFSDSSTATSAVLGLYSGVATGTQTGGSNSVVYLTSVYGASSSDEGYFVSSADFDAFRDNVLAPGNAALTYWNALYARIARANSALDGLNKTTTISTTLKNQLLGETKFWRAWFYFQLINYFGDVPLVINTDALNNALLPRAAKALVYNQIVTDLTEAKNHLTTQYPSIDRARINKNVASAFLARVYFYQENWKDAETEAANVINSGVYSIVRNLDNVFLNTSNETIWQISLVNTTTAATVFGANFIPTTATPLFVLYDTLAKSFEANDQRKLKWAKAIADPANPARTLYYPFKYKVKNTTAGNEYPVMLRLAEMYLIRGEAASMQDKPTEAKRDLDTIRVRAGLLPFTSTVKTDLLKAFEQERWKELFTESGDRWFNLKRLNKATAALSPVKPLWKPFQQLYPIPQAAMTYNTALKDNDGYFQ